MLPGLLVLSLVASTSAAAGRLHMPEGAAIGSLQAASGPVLVVRDGQASPLSVGDSLSAVDIIRTGSGGRARVSLADGSALLVGGEAELRVALHDVDNQRTLIELLHGRLVADVHPVTKHGGAFVIRTPTADTAVLGSVVTVETALIDTSKANSSTALSKRELENLPGRTSADLLRTLSDAVPGRRPAENTPTIDDYREVGATLVLALDHRAVVSNVDAGVEGATYLMPTQFSIVGRGQAPTPPRMLSDHQRPVLGFGQPSKSGQDATHFYDLDAFDRLQRETWQDFDAQGAPCTPPVVLNGTIVSGAAKQVGKELDEPVGRFKVVGNGTSTGNALTVQVTNLSSCPLYFIVTDGTIMAPKGFTGRLIAGLIAGNPAIKDFQKMITMGGTVRVAGRLEPATQKGSRSATDTASGSLHSYCLEIHKLAPHLKTEYKFADDDDQRELGPNRDIVDRAFRLAQSRQLQLPETQSLDSSLQWTLWRSREQMKQKEFLEEYHKLVQKNYEAKKQKIDKPLKEKIERSGSELFATTETILTAR